MQELQTTSPCRGLCVLDPTTEVCQGCNRTLTEIQCWSIYTPEEKHAINTRVQL